MLLLGHWPTLAGADARLFELRPVAGIDGSSLMGHRVGSCAFSPITLVDSAIPIISVLEAAEEALACRVVRAAALPRHGADQAVSLAYADPAGPSVMASPVRVADRALARGERPARVLQGAVGERRVRAPPAGGPGAPRGHSKGLFPCLLTVSHDSLVGRERHGA